MQHDYLIRYLALFLMIEICMFFGWYPLTLQLVQAAERYERKSISFLNQILLMPSADQIPADKASELMVEINEQIKMPRFDNNPLPGVSQAQFWNESPGYFSQTRQALSSIKASMDNIDHSISDAQQHIADLDGQISSAFSAGQDASKYITERKEYQDRQKELSDRRDSLLAQRRKEEEALFKQAEELLNKVIAPELFKVLSDPELQRFRAQEYVTEEDRNKFIVQKAKELGITSEDLEKVMDSAYLYITFLTDYGRLLTRDQDTGKRKVTYHLSGGIIWFKLIPSEERVYIETLKVIRLDESASADPDTNYPLSTLDGDTGAFRKASESFAEKLKLETLNIDDFALKAGVVEVSGGKVRFPLGKKEGIFVDQKFRVYEREKRGEKIIEKKRGFFYVDKIGDNNVNRDELSRGKLVISGAEPGMQIREFSNPGIDVSIRLGTGKIKIARGISQASGYALKVKEEVNTPVYALNFTVQYDIGRKIQIPQSFFTIGGDAGILTSSKGITIEPYSEEPSAPVYFDVYAGFLKKFYVRRVALCFEPLVQYQLLSVSHTDGNEDTVTFETSTASFLPKIGIEFAIREDMNAGLTVSSSLPILATDEWSAGKQKKAEGSPAELGKDIVGSAVTYPKAFFGVYISYCLPKLW